MKKRVIMMGILFCLLYFVPLSFIVYHKNSKIAVDVDYIIVLGAKVNGYQPSEILRYRLKAAIEYFEQHPDTKIIVSGGQGKDEEFAEALVMKMYLQRYDIPEENIIMEDQSTNTFENIKNSKELIKEGSSIGVVTNDFHIFRSSMICHRIFSQKCEMQSAQNYAGAPGLYSLLREPFALYKSFLVDR